MRASERTTTRRTLLRWFIATTAVTAMTASAFAADAGPVPTTMDVELAQIAGSAGAPSVPSGYPDLALPPFNVYSHYEVVDTKTISLSTTTVSQKLMDGSTIEATLNAGKADVAIKDGSGQTMSKGKYALPPKSDKHPTVFVISVPYKSGNLVIGLTRK